jgi:hypothetical protein
MAEVARNRLSAARAALKELDVALNHDRKAYALLDKVAEAGRQLLQPILEGKMPSKSNIDRFRGAVQEAELFEPTQEPLPDPED